MAKVIEEIIKTVMQTGVLNIHADHVIYRGRYRPLRNLSNKNRLVIVHSSRPTIRLIGRLSGPVNKEFKINGMQFVEMPGYEETARGSHYILGQYFRRHAWSEFGIKDQEEMELRTLFYITDEKNALLIDKCLEELKKHPYNLSLNRDDSI